MTVDAVEQDSQVSDMSDEWVATQAGQEALDKIHTIEREMLSRAIFVLTQLTGQTAEGVIANLSAGLDEEYEEASGAAEAKAKLTRGLPVKKLVIPGGAL